MVEVGPGDGTVAGVDRHVGILSCDPIGERRPVREKLALGGAKMRVGDLQYAHVCGHLRFIDLRRVRRRPRAIGQAATGAGSGS